MAERVVDQCSVRHVGRRRKLLLLLLVFVLLLPVAAWRLYDDRDYWVEAWSQQSLLPEAVPEDDLSPAQERRIRLARQRAEESFDLARTTIPREEIRAGGPAKDGIPAITDPVMLPAVEATYLEDDDRIIGVVQGGAAKAYPLRILTYHEIVNDQIGDAAVAVTYCPLCDSAAVFDRRTPIGLREFGVSGMLYNSNVLMYDRGGDPESLWSQLRAKGVSSVGSEAKLKPLPVELTTWSAWRRRHPRTLVLSNQTGFSRDYNRDPYAGYFERPELTFPVNRTSDAVPPKERVLGVWTEGDSRAYLASSFSEGESRIEDELAGRKVVVQFDSATDSFRVVEADEGVSWVYSLWFAWYAFHPNTTIYESE